MPKIDLEKMDYPIYHACMCMHVLELTDDYAILSFICPKCYTGEVQRKDIFTINFRQDDVAALQLREYLRKLVEMDPHANIGVELRLTIEGRIIKETEDLDPNPFADPPEMEQVMKTTRISGVALICPACGGPTEWTSESVPRPGGAPSGSVQEIKIVPLNCSKCNRADPKCPICGGPTEWWSESGRPIRCNKCDGPEAALEGLTKEKWRPING